MRDAVLRGLRSPVSGARPGLQALADGRHDRDAEVETDADREPFLREATFEVISQILINAEWLPTCVKPFASTKARVEPTVCSAIMRPP